MTAVCFLFAAKSIFCIKDSHPVQNLKLTEYVMIGSFFQLFYRYRYGIIIR
jgi:hypothetical protein